MYRVFSVLKKVYVATNPNSVYIHTSCTCHRFWESNPKGEWKDEKFHEQMEADWKAEFVVNESYLNLDESEGNQRKTLYGLKTGFKDLREEIIKWKDEWQQRITDDSNLYVYPDDQEQIFNFNSTDSLKRWTTISDNDHNQGFSRCTLSLSPTGKGLFQGYVNTVPPKDGRIKKAGYCSMKSDRKLKSFHRESYYEWDAYTHLILRVRGDGRSYVINLSVAGYFDIEWNDIYHYILYTRGGPYWQFVKIPFSKFVFASKGRVQDYQSRVPLDRIASVGLAVGKIDGPFSLEIDYIGVECDPTYTEEFAYEMYQIPKNIANV